MKKLVQKTVANSVTLILAGGVISTVAGAIGEFFTSLNPDGLTVAETFGHLVILFTIGCVIWYGKDLPSEDEEKSAGV